MLAEGPSARLPDRPVTAAPPSREEAARNLGARVAHARRASGLTLAGLAERTELSPAYLSQIESATANPTLSTLVQVAASLFLSPSELLGSHSDPLSAARFEPRIAPIPVAACGPGVQAVWDLSAVGSTRLAGRLMRGSVGNHDEPVTHVGEEFLVVLEGRCCLRVADVVRELRATDTCHFAACDPHQITDVSDDLLLLAILSEV